MLELGRRVLPIPDSMKLAAEAHEHLAANAAAEPSQVDTGVA